MQDTASRHPSHADGLRRAESTTPSTPSAATPHAVESALAALERSQARVAQLERENGMLAERLAGLERVRDAAIAHAAGLEEKLADSAPRRPEPVPSLPTKPTPLTPNAVRAATRWRRSLPWVASAGLLLAVIGSSCGQGASVKHTGLCTTARMTLDRMSESSGGGPVVGEEFWAPVRSAIDVAAKTC